MEDQNSTFTQNLLKELVTEIIWSLALKYIEETYLPVRFELNKIGTYSNSLTKRKRKRIHNNLPTRHPREYFSEYLFL